MAELAIDALLRSIETNGTSLGAKSTALSHLIETIDKRLSQLDGKLPIEIRTSGGHLKFDRNGEGWAILIVVATTWQPLKNASIQMKAQAFPALMSLLLKLEQTQEDTLKKIDEALSSVNVKIMDELLKKMEGE